MCIYSQCHQISDQLTPCSFLTAFISPIPPHLSSTGGRPNTKQYIVHLSSVPSVLSYRGGVNGLRATATVDDEEDEYEDEEDVDDLDEEDDEDYGEIGDAVESGEDGFDADVQFAAAAAAEEALKIAGSAAAAAAAAAGGAGRGLGGEGSGGGGGGGAVRVSALPFARTGVDVLVERVGERLRNMKSRSVGRRLLARVAAAAVAAAAEEAAEEAAAGAAGGGAAPEAAASFTEHFQNSTFYPSAVSAAVSSVRITPSSASSTAATPAGDKAPMASGATLAVLTGQQLSARAARIMRSTPWGRLMRPDVRLPHVRAFTRFLEASHHSLLQSLKIPSSAIFHSYTYLMNSFAVQLTAAEARRLKRHPAVAEVERDRTVRVTSVHSPEFLKLDSSLWPANGGQSNAGEGVIIGVIDTGIWPEHPSFSNPDPNGAPYSAAPARWRGVCTKTKDFTACNSKVVGARYFLKGMEREYGRVGSRLDYRSPRDMEQHGTWCAGAAAGNAGVDVTIGGRNFGAASGMAPRARLAIYKGLWIADGYHGVGVMSDLIAAANKAVADGVDVISCSWGGMALYFKDIPYLQGLKAGVVTAFAAGNEGRPNPWSMWGTLSNVSPFYLTVGASTMGREYKAVLTLGDGTTFTGRSLGGTTATASDLPLVLDTTIVLLYPHQAPLIPPSHQLFLLSSFLSSLLLSLLALFLSSLLFPLLTSLPSFLTSLHSN
ncbi:unnamed protein product [Closterium sp. Naga37s-1]|nr:unnamed protein product [Closterium sp. Naga37s-1]